MSRATHIIGEKPNATTPDFDAEVEATLMMLAHIKVAVTNRRRTSVHARLMNHADTAERSLLALRPLLSHWVAEVCVGAPLIVEKAIVVDHSDDDPLGAA